MCIALTVLTSCKKDDPEKAEPLPQRTVLIYIAGENNLNSVIKSEMDEMKVGSKSIGNNCLLVYVDGAKSGELPYLARINEGEICDSVSISDMGISSKDEYSSDPAVMESVLRYAFSNHKSENDDYGLVLWGHASGWLIDDSLAYNAMSRMNVSVSGRAKPRKAYGGDTGDNSTSTTGRYWLNIPTLASLLGKVPHLKFIFADCCNFQCLENAYELRNVTDYIIGSPAEIPDIGAPYNTVVPAMFESTTFAESVIDRYYEQAIGGRKTPLSVIKTSGMNDLAAATRTALLSFVPTLDSPYPDMTGIIHYYYYYRYHDANNFMLKYAPADIYTSWKQAFDNVVVHRLLSEHWVTNRLWDGYYYDFQVTEETYGGASMFVPQSPYVDDYSSYNSNIRKMAWYYAAGLSDVGW